MDFSVVIPVHNRAHGIERTLRSVWDQTVDDLEVILVDDGSTDNLSEVLARNQDGRLRVISKANGGPASARNVGVEESRGRWIAYLDSDDRWFPDHLQALHQHIQESDAEAGYAPVLVDRGVGRYFLKPSRPMSPGESFGDYRFVAGEPVYLSTLLLSRDLATQLSWDESLFYGDVDQYVHDLCLIVGTPAMLNRPTAVYDDVTGPDKLSQLWVDAAGTEKFQNFVRWVDGRRSELSPEALLAFGARNESGLEPSVTGALRVILRAYAADVIGLTDVGRELLRARWPAFYRYLIDSYVYLRGDPLDVALSCVETLPEGTTDPRDRPDPLADLSSRDSRSTGSEHATR